MKDLSDREIAEILQAGMSPRMARIDRYQRYVDGTVYDGRPGFLDTKSEAPLTERAPCVVYPAVRNAQTSYSTMCIGGERFPQITSLTSEDDSAFDPRFGLSPEDSSTLDAGIGKIGDQVRFQSFFQCALETAIASGTVPVLACLQKGRLKLLQLDPKCTEPEFKKDDPEIVEAVEVSYRYVTTDWDPQDKKWKKRVWQYRRRIDDRYDTVFVPVAVEDVNERPVPRAEQTKYKHGFGFCPVVWYKFRSPMEATGDYDGKPIHFGLLSLIDTINFGLSQRYRAALYCGDPQIVETGVEDDEARLPMGRMSEAVQPTADPTGWGMGLSARKVPGAARMVRKKGAGTVWRYTSPDADVKILTLSGDALKCLSEDVADNISKLREALGHVYIDPQDLSGSVDVSGKTLALMFETQIRECNRIREDFGRCCILPVLNMLFRIILKAGNGLYLAGASKLKAILERFEQPIDGIDGVTWFEPTLKLKWGDYFEPSDVDEATRVKVALDALTADTPVITKRTAVEHIKPVFGIVNADQYVEELQKEADEREAKLHDAMMAMQGNAAGVPSDGDGGGDGDSSAKPASAPSGGPGNRGAAAKPRAAKPARPARSPVAST